MTDWFSKAEALSHRMASWNFMLALLCLVSLVLIQRLVGSRKTPARSEFLAGEEKVRQETHPENHLARKIVPLEGFQWDQTKPKVLRPFKPIYHITMALQSSQPSELIEIDSNYLERVQHRRDVIAKHPTTVTGAVPEGVAPSRELYAYLLTEYLPARYPSMFSISRDGAEFRNHVTGRGSPTTPPADALELLRILGENVEDDLLLLVETPEGHRMVSFVCCHPSGFDPSAKLGKLLRDIHTPVPSYDKIASSMERFFSRHEVGKVVKRLNWAITTVPELFTPRVNHVHEGDEFQADELVDIDKARFRVELQALSRLPQTRALLFSFKSYLYPLADIKEEGLGPDLAEAIEGLKKGNAPGMWMYKGGVRWGKSVCEYLRA